jgi:choline transport protein
VVLACTSLTATFIALLACSRNHYPSASHIFTDTTNSTGWSSDGFAFILAIANAVYSFLGTDAAAHLCEEIPRPGKNVPKVMLWPILMGIVTAWPFAVSCMASIINVDEVLSTSTGLPLLEIYYQGTGSRAAATVLMSLFAICFYGCAVANGKQYFPYLFLRILIIAKRNN